MTAEQQRCFATYFHGVCQKLVLLISQHELDLHTVRSASESACAKSFARDDSSAACCSDHEKCDQSGKSLEWCKKAGLVETLPHCEVAWKSAKSGAHWDQVNFCWHLFPLLLRWRHALHVCQPKAYLESLPKGPGSHYICHRASNAVWSCPPE